MGASGYSGEVLVELLARHPKVQDLVVASSNHGGERVESILPRLAGLLGDRHFIHADLPSLKSASVDVWFLALPHGIAAEYAIPLVENGSLVIDLSADFRLNSPEVYSTYYGKQPVHPDWLPRVPYVMPELSERNWKDSELLACPGCYPTSVLLPLIPLLRAGLLSGKGIVVSAMSGISGAGKKSSLEYAYCERSESVKAYGVGVHRHLSEIEEQLSSAAGTSVMIQFTPHLVPMMRGLASTIIVPYTGTVEAVYFIWKRVFSGRSSIRLLPPEMNPDTRHVVGTNRADISAYVDSRTGNLVVTSAIDNLLKGAGGQAVQIWNIKMGWPENTGLM